MSRQTPVNPEYTIAAQGVCNGTRGYRGDIWVEYREISKDIAANTRRIKAYCYVALNYQYDTAYCSGSRGMYSTFSVNGVSGTNLKNNGSFNFREHEPMLLGSYEGDIEFNADGTKTISVNGTFTTDVLNISDGSVGGTITLTPMPRATTPVVPAIILGNSGSIDLSSRADPSFTHTLKYKIGSAEDTIATTTTAASYSWRPPIALAKQIKSATSGTCTITCETYSGEALAGSKVVNCELSVPSSVEPSVTDITIDKKSSNTTVNGWEELVKGYCAATLTAAAQGAYDSSIISYRFEVRKGSEVLFSTSQSSNVWESGLFTVSGADINFYVEVTDSRGRKDSYTSPYHTVYEYEAPYISGVEGFRCNSEGVKDLVNGTYISAKGMFNVSSVNGHNAKTTKIEYKKHGDTAWTLGQNDPDDNSVYVFGEDNISTQSAYEIKFTVTDSAYGAISSVVMVMPGFVTMHVRTGGKGIGVGGVADDDEFQMFMPSRFIQESTFDNNVNVSSSNFLIDGEPIGDIIAGGDGGTLIPTGTIMMWSKLTAPTNWLLCNGQAVSRSVYNDLFIKIGTTYGSGDGSTTFNLPNLSGRFPIGIDKDGDADFDFLGEIGGEKTHTLLESEMPAHSHTVNSHAHTIAHKHNEFSSDNENQNHSHSHTHGNITVNSSSYCYTSLSDYTLGVWEGGYNVVTALDKGSHSHTVDIPSKTSGGNSRGHTHIVDIPDYSGNSGWTAPPTNSKGSGSAHNNMPPYLAVNFIIAYQDIKIPFKGDQGEQGIQGEQGEKGDNAPPVQYQFSADGTSWHSAFATGDAYLRFSCDDGITWGDCILFKGDKGDTGDTGEKGTSFRHLGAWNSATEYVCNSSYVDVVESNGSGYACKTTHTGQEPPNTTYWDLVALKGMDGEGTGDVIGPASSTDGSVAVFDSTTGKVIKDSGEKLSDYLPKTGGTFTGDVTAPRLRLTAADDASASSTLHALQIGADSETNLVIDNNEIIARNNDAYSPLYLNSSMVQVGGGTFNVTGESTFNDRVNMNKPLQVTYTDRAYSAYISTSSTTNEYIFGGSDASDFSASRYIRIGDNKLQYSYQDSSDVWYTHDLFHSGNLTPSNYLTKSGGTITGNIAMSNKNITGVNLLAINDEGSSEGISFTGGGSGTTYLNRIDDENLRIVTPNGYIDLGPKNTSTCHIYTDRGTFYFNKNLLVNGDYVRLKYGSDRKSYTLAANTNLSVSIGEGETVHFEVADRFSGDLCMYINGDTNLGNYKSIYWRSGNSVYTQRNFLTYGSSTSYMSHAQGKIFVLDGDTHISGKGMRGESTARMGTFEMTHGASSVSSIRFDKQVEITLTKVNYG